MHDPVFHHIRQSLLEKRTRVGELIDLAPTSKKGTWLGPAGEQAVRSHLKVIDGAIEKASAGTLGECKVCHEPVEEELLEMDYTAEVCLAHLSGEELRSLESQLELAKTVQRGLLPEQVPEVSSLELSAFSRPAQIVGGDYFDFFRFWTGAHGIAIADVAGHGISASLQMASLQALLRTLIPASDSPGQVADHVNSLMIHNVRFTTFVTLFLASIEPTSGALTYCNAGHNPPLLLRNDGGEAASPEWLSPTGPAIGLVEEGRYEEQRLQLGPGDIMVLYTDGIVEADDGNGVQFGAERLMRLVQRERAATVRDLVHRIRTEVERFTSAGPMDDDLTVVVCRYVG